MERQYEQLHTKQKTTGRHLQRFRQYCPLVLVSALGAASSILLVSCGGGGAGFPAPNSPLAISVSITPTTAQVQTSATQQFTASVTGSTNTSVIWEVNGVVGGNASAGGITASGLYTAPSTVPSPATVTVSAVSVAESTKSAAASLTVVAALSITSVSVSCSPPTINTTQSSTCSANVAGTGAFNNGVLWSVSPSSAGSVNSSGVFTPIAAGSATVTAISTQDGTKSGSATVDVGLHASNLAVNPTLYASGTQTATGLTIWLPDSDLDPTSVSADEVDAAGNEIKPLGSLNDNGTNGDQSAGDKIYTLQFPVTDSSATTHHYRVSYRATGSAITYTSNIVEASSVPTVVVTDEPSYASAINDTLIHLTKAIQSYKAIQPSPSASPDPKALDTFSSSVEAAIGDLQQLAAYDAVPARAALRQNRSRAQMSFASSLWSWLPFGLGTATSKRNELAAEEAVFTGTSFSPDDPRVAGVMSYALKNGLEADCDPDIESDATCRIAIWSEYSTSPDAGLLSAAATSALDFGITESAGVAEDGTGALFDSQSDLSPVENWAVGQAAGSATDGVIDRYVSSSGRQMLIVGTATDGESTLLPNGTHEIILATGSTHTDTPNVQTPEVNDLSPDSVPAGGPSQTITINGSGFVPTSAVALGRADCAVNYVNSGELTINTSCAALSLAGSYPLLVVNPAPNGSLAASDNLGVYGTITVSSPQSTLGLGGTETLTGTASVGLNDGGTPAMSWSATDGTIASTTGAYTAPTSLSSSETVTITASAPFYRSGSTEISVLDKGVSVAPTTATVETGAQTQFTATPINLTSDGIVWSIVGNDAANDLGVISSTGLYTAPSRLPVMNPVTVEATSSAIPSLSAAAQVNITAGAETASTLVVDPPDLTMTTGQQATFIAVGPSGRISGPSWGLLEPSGGSISAGGTYIAPTTPGVYHVVASTGGSSAFSSVTVVASNSTGINSVFQETGSMIQARAGASATLLGSGQVLVAGGWYQDFSGADYPLASAELYDSTTGTFSATGSMASPRLGQAAVLLTSGKVLLAGGIDQFSPGQVTASTEIYDPSTGAFTATGSMTQPRAFASAALLADGKVLICGGEDPSRNASQTAEIYDPSTGQFTATGTMSTGRVSPASALLPNGDVLIAGGYVPYVGILSSVERYNASTGGFAVNTGMAVPLSGDDGRKLGNAEAFRLQTGRLLILGYDAQNTGGVPEGQIFDPTSSSFSSPGPFAVCGDAPVWLPFASVLLSDGDVLAAGVGAQCSSGGQLYLAGSNKFAPLADPMIVFRSYPAVSILPTGAVLVAGGLADLATTSGYAVAGAEVFH